MTKDIPLADRLTRVEDNLNNSSTSQLDAAFEDLLKAEAHHEERVRKLAIGAWTGVFVCLVVAAGSFLAIQDIGGSIVNVARFAFLVSAGTGVIALAAGSLASAVWLFRSRTPTLRAIDRRLARLESMIGQG